MAEDLKFIRQELFEAYEMNDRILVGYALNRLDTYLKEQKEVEEKYKQTPAFSEVVSPAEPDSDEIVDASVDNTNKLKQRFSPMNPLSTSAAFQDGVVWLLNYQKAKAGSGGTPV